MSKLSSNNGFKKHRGQKDFRTPWNRAKPWGTEYGINLNRGIDKGYWCSIRKAQPKLLIFADYNLEANSRLHLHKLWETKKPQQCHLLPQQWPERDQESRPRKKAKEFKGESSKLWLAFTTTSTALWTKRRVSRLVLCLMVSSGCSGSMKPASLHALHWCSLTLSQPDHELDLAQIRCCHSSCLKLVSSSDGLMRLSWEARAAMKGSSPPNACSRLTALPLQVKRKGTGSGTRALKVIS